MDKKKHEPYTFTRIDGKVRNILCHYCNRVIYKDQATNLDGSWHRMCRSIYLKGARETAEDFTRVIDDFDSELRKRGLLRRR